MPEAGQQLSPSLPRTETEKQLAAIWMELLAIDEVKTTYNFIDLGGDSLAATLCISRIRKAFDVELQIEDFFLEESTLAAIAQLIDQISEKKQSLDNSPKSQ